MTGIIPAPTSFELRDERPFRLTESSRLVADGEGAAAVAETFAAAGARGHGVRAARRRRRAGGIRPLVRRRRRRGARRRRRGLHARVGRRRRARRGRHGGGAVPRHPVAAAAAARRDRANGCRDGARRRMDRARGIRRRRPALRLPRRDARRRPALLPRRGRARATSTRIALLKLNVLHLHLTDDQGWRIQIDSWPELTGIGASTSVGGDGGGFYTKDDYRAHRRVRGRAVRHDRARDRPARAHERGAQRLPRAELRRRRTRSRTRASRSASRRCAPRPSGPRRPTGSSPTSRARSPSSRPGRGCTSAATSRSRPAAGRLPRPRAAHRRRPAPRPARRSSAGTRWAPRASCRAGTVGQYWSFVEPEDDAAELTPLVRRAGRQRHPVARRRRLPRHEVRRRPAGPARPHARPRLGEGPTTHRRGVPAGSRPRSCPGVDETRHPRRRGADLDRDARHASRTSSSWRSRASPAIAEIAWSPAPAAGAARDTAAFFGRGSRRSASGWDAAGITYYPVRGRAPGASSAPRRPPPPPGASGLAGRRRTGLTLELVLLSARTPARMRRPSRPPHRSIRPPLPSCTLAYVASRARRRSWWMDLIGWAGTRSGIVHQHDVRAGYTRYAVRRALEHGGPRRIRGPWLATPDAPPSLVRAARLGGRLACVSATGTTACGRSTSVAPCRYPALVEASAGREVLHRSAGRSSIIRYELVEPVVNALVHVADCRRSTGVDV